MFTTKIDFFNYLLYSTLIFVFPIQLYSQIQYFETKLPIIIIDTNGQTIVDEPKINAAMGIIYNGTGQLNKTTDPYNHYNGRIGIEIRGNTSQLYPKKSYAVETRDAASNDLKVSLLGMPSESDWVLYGPYSDKTLMRNALAYYLARKLGNYAPRTRFCEVIINSDYKGIYLLIESIKRDVSRVNIANLTNSDNSGDELTGGYIFKIDSRTGSDTEGWSSPYARDNEPGTGLFYQYHYPKQDKITSEQKLYIKNKVTDFENVMASSFKYDVNIGYYRFLDMDDVVKYFIINEACKNYDFGTASFFLYKDKDSKDPKIHFGPVWDFNISSGNSLAEEFRSPQGWVSDLSYNPWGTPLGRPFWFKFIWNDNTFQNLFKYKMRSVRSNNLSNSVINSAIYNMVNEISDAVDRNFTRWPILNTTIDHAALGTFNNEVEYLKNWWSDRFNWIDSVAGSPISSDSTAPSVPSNFTATSYNGYVHLSWDPNTEDDIWSYKIFRDRGVGDLYMDLLAQVSGNDSTYIDSVNLKNNTTYFYQISAQDNASNESQRSPFISTTTLQVLNNNELEEFRFNQNNPNPFNSNTVITFSLAAGSEAILNIYDMSGRLIKTLLNDYQTLGEHSISWDGTDENGKAVSSGIYLYSANIEGIIHTKKMLFLK